MGFVISEVGPVLDLALAALQHHRPGHSDELKLNTAKAQMNIVQRWKAMTCADEPGEYYPFCRQQTRLEAFWRTVFLDRYRVILPKRATTLSRFPSVFQEEGGKPEVSEDGGKEQKGEAEGETGKDGEFDFQIVKCAFPPRTADEEDTIMWYLRHEVIEMWSFASVNLHSANLRFLKTEKGYIGVAHPNAEPGDRVVIFPGSPVPLVVRDYSEGHALIGQRFASPGV